MSRRTQKVEIYPANEESGLAFVSTDLGHIFKSNLGNEFGVMLRGKRPHKPKFARDIVDTKTPLLCCFLFVSKLKAGQIKTTGQYMNCQTFTNLQFRPLLKSSFNSFHTDFRDTSGEQIPLYLSVSLVLF